MPTATATQTTTSSATSLKPSLAQVTSVAATLRSLYPRAARAFLQRDVALTYSLLSSAFALLHPPVSLELIHDTLSSHRRKWEILRITSETTLYSSPQSTQATESLPAALRANLMLTPEPLMMMLHSRSLQLFTPVDPPQKPTSAFLPGQILVTLVLSSLKLDCPEVGRSMIEDWLAKRGQEYTAEDAQAYAKVLELYCLHVLPRLQDLEYAEDFITYERDLPHDVREQFIASLRQLRAEAASSSRVQAALSAGPSASSSYADPARLSSPAPSDSSASSSSTHTATPHTPRAHANGHAHGLAPLTPSQSPTPKPREDPHSASSSSIASIATSRTITPQTADRERAKTARRGAQRTNGHANGHAISRSKSRSDASTPAATTSALPTNMTPVIRRSSFGAAATESSARPPSTFALVRASLHGVVQNTSRSRVLLYTVLFVVVPIVSFVLRIRRKAQTRANALTGTLTPAAGGRAVDAVRRRLRVIDGQGNTVGKVWEEIARAVMDTVRMAGQGLV